MTVHTRHGLASTIILVSMMTATLMPGAGAAETVVFESTLGEAWDPVFLAFPTEGTGSLATGRLLLIYDTESNAATRIDLDVRGLAIADLVHPLNDASHVHPPNGSLRIIDVGSLGFVDEPGGFSLSGGTAVVLSESWEQDLLDEQAWINVHTNAFPGGEIAGRLTRVEAVPPAHPGWLVGLALVVAGRQIRRGPTQTAC